MLCVSIQIFFITCGGDTNLSGLTSGRLSGVSIKSNQINGTTHWCSPLWIRKEPNVAFSGVSKLTCVVYESWHGITVT